MPEAQQPPDIMVYEVFIGGIYFCWGSRGTQ